MSGRTIVGSGPARRPLPLGREAVERALRSVIFWLHDRTGGDVGDANYSGSCVMRLHHPYYDRYIDWVPREYWSDTAAQLRERLRGYP